MTWEKRLDSLARELGLYIEDAPPPPVVVVPIPELDEDADRPHEHGIDCCCWPDHCFEPS